MCLQWALLTEELDTKINLNPPLERISLGGLLIHVRTHQEACVFLSERHIMQTLEIFQASELRTARGSSTDCILNAVAQY